MEFKESSLLMQGGYGLQGKTLSLLAERLLAFAEWPPGWPIAHIRFGELRLLYSGKCKQV